jgi:hypothetical protein
MKNNNGRGILLASFFTPLEEEDIMKEVQRIADTLELTNGLIFLLSDLAEPSKKILTYNVYHQKGKPYNAALFTMRVHRKKQTNTLYTINGLNHAIASENNGETGKHLKLNWENYRDSILLSVNKELKVIHLELTKIFKVEPPPPGTEE